MWRVIGTIGICIVVAALLTALFWPLAGAIAAHDVRDVPKAQWGEKLRVARDAARGRIVQVIAGLLATGGFVYTTRNLRVKEAAGPVDQRACRCLRQGLPAGGARLVGAPPAPIAGSPWPRVRESPDQDGAAACGSSSGPVGKTRSRW